MSHENVSLPSKQGCTARYLVTLHPLLSSTGLSELIISHNTIDQMLILIIYQDDTQIAQTPAGLEEQESMRSLCSLIGQLPHGEDVAGNVFRPVI